MQLALAAAPKTASAAAVAAAGRQEMLQDTSAAAAAAAQGPAAAVAANCCCCCRCCCHQMDAKEKALVPTHLRAAVDVLVDAEGVAGRVAAASLERCQQAKCRSAAANARFGAGPCAAAATTRILHSDPASPLAAAAVADVAGAAAVFGPQHLNPMGEKLLYPLLLHLLHCLRRHSAAPAVQRFSAAAI